MGSKSDICYYWREFSGIVCIVPFTPLLLLFLAFPYSQLELAKVE